TSCSASRNWLPICSAIPVALPRSTAMPPRARSNPATGQRKRVCLARKWTLRSRASMATIPTRKSQFEVWGPTARISLGCSGIAPTSCQPLRRCSQRPRPCTRAGRPALWQGGIGDCALRWLPMSDPEVSQLPLWSVFPGGEEPYPGMPLLGKTQVDPGGSEVGEVSAAVDGQIFRHLGLELLDVLGGLGLHPAGSGDIDRLILGIHTVFVLQPIGHHIKLELAHRPHHHIVVGDGEEHLGGALFRQLLQPLVEGLGAQGVPQADTAEQLRGEVGYPGELEVFTLGEGIADLNAAVVVKSDDIPGQGLFDIL